MSIFRRSSPAPNRTPISPGAVVTCLCRALAHVRKIPLALGLTILGSNLAFACDEFILSSEQAAYFNRELAAEYVAPVGEVAFVGDNIPVGKKRAEALRNKNTEELPEIEYGMLKLRDKKDKKEKINHRNNPRCSFAADFNGDDVMDFAGLYRLKNSQQRGNNWTLDLVILYSSNGAIKHTVYSYTGQYFEGKKKPMLVYLRRRGPGKVNLMPGHIVLDKPGIGVFRRGRPVAMYYWDKQTGGFSELSMGADD